MSIFLNLAKQHEELSAGMTHFRERDIYDDKLSMIDEVMELNKEMGVDYHKTWKNEKPIDLELLHNELIDVLFFILQMYNNNKEENKEAFLKEMTIVESYDWHDTSDKKRKKAVLGLIHLASSDSSRIQDIEWLLRYYYSLCFYDYNLTDDDIVRLFEKKLGKNHKRIGDEWL